MAILSARTGPALARWIALAAALLGTHAAAAPVSEYAVKATYLYKFVPFVEWPEAVLLETASPFTICIVGKDPFGLLLDQAVAGQVAFGRPLQAVRLSPRDSVDRCQVAFFGEMARDDYLRIVQRTRALPALTVDDSGARNQAIIQFVIDGRHVRFDIHEARAEAASLKISSKLLSLARQTGAERVP